MIVTASNFNLKIKGSEELFLDILTRLTGGVVSLTALTQFMIDNELLSQKAKTSWFMAATGIPFEDFCLRYKTPVVKLPAKTIFSNLEYHNNSENGRDYLSTVKAIIKVAKTVKTDEDFRAYFLDSGQIKTVSSLRSYMVKYFGMPLGSWEKLKDVNEEEIPFFVSLGNCKAYFDLLINKPEDWKELFFCNELNSSIKGSANFIADTPERRSDAAKEFLSFFE